MTTLALNKITSINPRSSIQHAPLDAGYSKLFSLDWWLVCFTLAFMVPIYKQFGQISVLLCVFIPGLILVRNLRLTWGALIYYVPLLAFPAFALISSFWSDAPDETLKHGSELLATFAFSIVMVRRTSVRGLTSAILVAYFTICAISLAVQPSAFKGVDFIGLFESKNFLGFSAQLLVGASIAILFDRGQPLALRWLALAGIAVGALDLVLAHSAGALLTSIIASLVFLIFLFQNQISLGWRLVLIGVLVIAVAILATSWADLIKIAQSFQTDVLHKDNTLTGRTQFWTYAKTLIAQRPILGHGYAAFWREGNLDSIGLWRIHGITQHHGINFHNQFLETEVDFGLIGLVLVIAYLGAIGFASIVRVIKQPDPSTAFIASMMIALYSRLPVESTLFGAWSVFTLVLIAIAVHSAAPVDSTR